MEPTGGEIVDAVEGDEEAKARLAEMIASDPRVRLALAEAIIREVVTEPVLSSVGEEVGRVREYVDSEMEELRRYVDSRLEPILRELRAAG